MDGLRHPYGVTGGSSGGQGGGNGGASWQTRWLLNNPEDLETQPHPAAVQQAQHPQAMSVLSPPPISAAAQLQQIQLQQQQAAQQVQRPPPIMTQPIPRGPGAQLAASTVDGGGGGGTAAGGGIANHQEPPEHRATMLKVKVAARAGSILLVKPVDAEFDPEEVQAGT